jgi:hypothetical protein
VTAKDSEDAIKAITLTVSQTDGVQKSDSAAGTKNYNPAKEKIEIDADPEEVEEPKKVTAKKPAPAETRPTTDISALVADWDDE